MQPLFEFIQWPSGLIWRALLVIGPKVNVKDLSPKLSRMVVRTNARDQEQTPLHDQTGSPCKFISNNTSLNLNLQLLLSPPCPHILILHYWGLCTESFLGSFSSKTVVFKPVALESSKATQFFSTDQRLAYALGFDYLDSFLFTKVENYDVGKGG
jgi:hypothetical protein